MGEDEYEEECTCKYNWVILLYRKKEIGKEQKRQNRREELRKIKAKFWWK